MDSVSDSKSSTSQQGAPSKNTSATAADPASAGALAPLPVGWVPEWETFANSDGATKLFGELWRSEPWKGPRALVILHGFGEHSGRYRQFPGHLSDVFDAIYGFDQRGHGRSEGLRGHIEDFDQLADDAALVIRRLDEKLKAKHGRSEIHVIGHSMGGQVLLRTLFKHPELPIRSAIFSAPLLGVRQHVPFYKRAAASALKRVWGKLQIPAGLEVEHLSRDPEYVNEYKKDRLVHDLMTPKFYATMQTALSDTLKRTSELPVPALFLVPDGDLIVDAELTLSYYKKLRDERKQLKVYPGAYHEPMNEDARAEFFADIKTFVK